MAEPFVPTGMAGEPGRDVPGDDPLPESRFIAPDARCPHPGRWHSTDGDSTEIEVSDVAYGLVRALQPDDVLETGTAFGQTAEQIALGLRENGRGVLWTLDPDGERLAYAQRRLARIGHTYGIASSSLDWTPPHDVRFGLVWLDSLYELRVPEFERFERFLAPGAVVCFHDTAPGRGGHRIASGLSLRDELDRCLGDRLLMLDLPTPRGLTIAQRRP